MKTVKDMSLNEAIEYYRTSSRATHHSMRHMQDAIRIMSWLEELERLRKLKTEVLSSLIKS